MVLKESVTSAFTVQIGPSGHVFCTLMDATKVLFRGNYIATGNSTLDSFKKCVMLGAVLLFIYFCTCRPIHQYVFGIRKLTLIFHKMVQQVKCSNTLDAWWYH